MSFPADLPITDPALIFALVMGIFLIVPLLFERLKIPGIIGLILAGVVAGPHGAGLLAQDFTLLSSLGLLYLIFLAGLELDLQKFFEHRRRSIIFGLISFGVPMAISLLVMPALGFSVPAALLIGAIIGSHTLLAYPIASRLGIVKNGAILTVVGGTLITDTLALAVLAVVAGSVQEGFSPLFIGQLLLSLTVYTGIVLWGVPRLGRWFFRNVPGQAPAEFIFLLCILFGVAYLAGLAGAEPIIGAFLAGLTLNRLIPRTSPLMTRVRFVGNTLFIPFFIFSVGMLVNPRALVEGWEVWMVAGVLVASVHTGKFLAAWTTRGLFNFNRAEGIAMFGLSTPQAAATLAVTFVGLEVGLFGEDVLNGVIIMILVTVFVGPALLERYGREIARLDFQKPQDPADAPQRILIPVSNPATADTLLDIAFLIREEASEEPVFPLMVVREEGGSSEAGVAEAERMLGHAVLYAASADVPVIPLTRVDSNIATGIVRGMAETRTTTVVVGWDGRSSARHGIFGSVLDQLLAQTHQLVFVAKMGHAVSTTRRIVLVLPPAIDHHPGFLGAVTKMKRLTENLDAEMEVVIVRENADDYAQAIEQAPPARHFEIGSVAGWGELFADLSSRLEPDDLVIAFSARRGTVAWDRQLEDLPGRLAGLVPESFIVVYPSEVRPAAEVTGAYGLPAALSPERVLVDLPTMSYRSAIRRMVSTGFVKDERMRNLVYRALVRSEGALSSEILPGVFVPHARVPGLREPMIFMATSSGGIQFPHSPTPANVVFILLSPEEAREKHLAMLSEIAATIRSSERLAELREARSGEDMYDWFRSASI